MNAFNEALDKGGPAGKPPFSYGLVGRWFIAMIAPKMKRTLKTPAKMNPTLTTPDGGFQPATVMAAFREVTESMIAVCNRADGLDLTRIRVASPFLNVLKLQIGAFLEGNAGHCLRHLAQAQRVVAHPDFPSES